jgi:hypothetical protein
MAGSLYPKHAPNFLASIDILPLHKSSRKGHPRNGLRLALAYPSDFATGHYAVSDVWPDFLDSKGNSMNRSIDLIGSYKAEMHIVFPEMVDVHFQRLSKDPHFLCVEGSGIVAHGTLERFLHT